MAGTHPPIIIGRRAINRSSAARFGRVLAGAFGVFAGARRIATTLSAIATVLVVGTAIAKPAAIPLQFREWFWSEFPTPLSVFAFVIACSAPFFAIYAYRLLADADRESVTEPRLELRPAVTMKGMPAAILAGMKRERWERAAIVLLWVTNKPVASAADSIADVSAQV